MYNRLLANLVWIIRSYSKSGDYAVYLQSAYDLLEAAYAENKLSLQEVVRACFGQVSAAPYLEHYRLAAEEVARHVDEGDGASAKNAYHNPLHFAKVAVSFLALTKLHNKQAQHDSYVRDEEVAQGLLAAVAHDFCHDGTGNMVSGVHHPFRLEEIAVCGARSKILCKRDSQDIKNALAYIYATDVSGDPSPALVIREWHDWYFDDKVIRRPRGIAVPRKIQSIVSSKHRTLVAGLLLDADVLPSAMGEKQHMLESERVEAEAGRIFSPSGGLFFLENMLKGRMTTDVARQLSDDFIPKMINKYRMMP